MELLSEILNQPNTHSVAFTIAFAFICIAIIEYRCIDKKFGTGHIFNIIFFISNASMDSIAVYMTQHDYETEGSLLIQSLQLGFFAVWMIVSIYCTVFVLKNQRNMRSGSLTKIVCMVFISTFAGMGFFKVAAVLTAVLLIILGFLEKLDMEELEYKNKKGRMFLVEVSCDVKRRNIIRAIEKYHMDVKNIIEDENFGEYDNYDTELLTMEILFEDENITNENVIKNLSEIEGIISVAKADEEI